MAYHQKNEADQAERHFQQALKYDVEWWDELVLKEACRECFSREASSS